MGKGVFDRQPPGLCELPYFWNQFMGQQAANGGDQYAGNFSPLRPWEKDQ